MNGLSALAGRPAQRIDDAHALRLAFRAPDLDDPGRAIQLTIETPFALRGADGCEYRCDPVVSGSLPLDLSGRVVREAAIVSSATLRLTFEDGTELRVEPDDHYEAWNVAGPGQALVVCPPGGGEVVIWS